tara:strand:+ start:39741 stop:43679 length:3939 start_codon:yes stop_codon:yes gene_type:complete
MTSFQRGVIELKIEGMEGGRFQEFVLRFLPLYSPSYDGIVRNGHTELGKTKAGVPDLLKTLDNGDQIGAECGTGEDYWKPPEDVKKYPEWKPIEDAEKSIQKMARPVEIILASSRPIPANYPNVKTAIIDYFASKTNARIILLTCTDLASWIERNLKRADIFELSKEFFPEVVENQTLIDERDALASVIDYGDKFGFPTKDILQILKASGITDPVLLEQQIATEIFGDDTRFSLEHPASFNGIPRCSKHLPLILNPFGKIVQLLGVPKIGKSNLCWEAITQAKYKYKWLSVPIDEQQHTDFVDALLILLYSQFISVSEAVKKVKALVSTNVRLQEKEISPLYLVIDNAHFLNLNQLKRLDFALKELRSLSLLSKIAIVLMTNKNLSQAVSSLDTAAVAPAWTSEELKELITRKNLLVSDPKPDEYFELLQSQCNGHPLFAVALAGKYSDRTKLILNKIESPKADDSELSNEIKSVLYQDILTTPDQQNFVQRLSILTGKSSQSVLDALRKDVQPQIHTTVSNLSEQIGPAVLEGSIEGGLQVSPAFKEVANKKIGTTEKNETFIAAANTLLKFEGKTLYADHWIDGIFYLILADNIPKAAASALLLLNGISNNDENRELNLKYTLDRLFYFKFLKNKTLDGMDYLTLCSLRLMMGHHHASLNNLKESAEYLEEIDVEKIQSIKVDFDGVEEMKRYLVMAVLSSRVLALGEMKDPVKTLVTYLDYLSKAPPDGPKFEVYEILPGLITRLKIDQLRTFSFSVLAERLYPERLSDLVKVAISIGYAARNDDLLQKNIFSLRVDIPSSNLFLELARSSLLSNTDKYPEALGLILKIEKSIADRGKDPNKLGGTFYQHFADTVWGTKDHQGSIAYYKKSSELEPNESESFLAWNQYKIGFASTDENEIITNFTESIAKFISVENYDQGSRALGALAAFHISKKNYAEGIKTGFRLAEWFHKDKKSEAGPSLRLLLAQMLRSKHDITGESLSHPGMNFPLPERQFYLTIQSEVTPEAGGVITYQVISNFAKTVGENGLAIEALKSAIYSDVTVEMDRNTLIINWFDLFGLLSPEDFNEYEVSLFIKKLLQYQPIPAAKNEAAYMQGFFVPFENRAKKEPSVWSPILSKVVEITRNIVSDIDSTLADRWSARLDYYEGLSCLLSGASHRAYNLFRRACRDALSKEIWDIGESAAFSASFELWQQHPSLLDAGTASFDLLKVIEAQSPNADKIRVLGINLYKFWSVCSWGRLSTSDYQIKDRLFDGAKVLKSHSFTEEEASPVMVALLKKSFGDYDSTKPTISSKKIPDEVLKILEKESR